MSYQYRITGAPGVDGEAMMTPPEIARAAGLSVDLVRKRLTKNLWRDWPRLTQTPEAAKAAQVDRARMRMTAEMGTKLRPAKSPATFGYGAGSNRRGGRIR